MSTKADNVYPTDVPVENCKLISVDLKIQESTNDFEYFNRNRYSEYTSNVGSLFDNVVQNETVIWTASCNNELTRNVLFYDGDEKYVLIIPNDSNLILFHQLKNNTWERTNTEINLNKLKMIDVSDYTLLWEYYTKEVGSEDLDGPLKLYRFIYYYYDLENYNFKIFFDVHCDRVIYDDKLVWNYKDDLFRPYPEYLNFNLIDKTSSSVLRDVPVKPVILDSDLIMSTDEFFTVCKSKIRHFRPRKGIGFKKLMEGDKVVTESNGPKYIEAVTMNHVEKVNKNESNIVIY